MAAVRMSVDADSAEALAAIAGSGDVAPEMVQVDEVAVRNVTDDGGKEVVQLRMSTGTVTVCVWLGAADAAALAHTLQWHADEVPESETPV